MSAIAASVLIAIAVALFVCAVGFAAGAFLGEVVNAIVYREGKNR